jgi:hypothetical protein
VSLAEGTSLIIPLSVHHVKRDTQHFLIAMTLFSGRSGAASSPFMRPQHHREFGRTWCVISPCLPRLLLQFQLQSRRSDPHTPIKNYGVTPFPIELDPTLVDIGLRSEHFGEKRHCQVSRMPNRRNTGIPLCDF